MSESGLESVTVTVIVCSHTLERWQNLSAAVESVHAQTLVPAQTIVVIDGDEELERRARSQLDGVEVVRNRHRPGLSGARQSGAELARGSILAFLDDDAVADDDWLEQLMAVYRDPMVLGVGGSIEPAWEQPPPRWFPPEFNWVVGCSYPGMPVSAERVRNVIGANMSMRAAVLARVGAFDSRLGRAPGARALSGSAEETELCIRAARLHPGHYWIYEPRARVVHAVPAQRGTWRYFVRRCAVEGTAKGVLTRIAGGADALRSERAYVHSVLPRAVRRELAGAARGRRDGLARASAIVSGLAITAGAYGWSRCTAAVREGTAAHAGKRSPSGEADGPRDDDPSATPAAPLASGRQVP